MMQEKENQKNKNEGERKHSRKGDVQPCSNSTTVLSNKHSRKGDIQQSAEYRVALITQELTALTKELIFQNNEKEARAAELILANKELIFQNAVKQYCTEKLLRTQQELALQYREKEERAAELVIANRELMFQNIEKEKRATDLVIIKVEHAEKEARAAELARSYNKNEILNKQMNHKKKLECMGRLTSGIAHDFNNILACVLGYNEMNQYVADDIADKVLRAELENNTEQVSVAVKRAAALIEILSSRRDAGKNGRKANASID